MFLISLYLFCVYNIYAHANNSDLQPIPASESESVSYDFLNNPITEHQAREQAHMLELQSDRIKSRDIDFSFYNNPFAFTEFDETSMRAHCSGFIEYVAWWANRQGFGEGEVFELLFPERPIYDADCRDINAAGDSAMTILDTRLRLECFGPKVLKASTFGFIESDVFGFDIINLRFRLWHAFLQLDWEQTTLLLGQFWHPFSVVNCFPLTVTVDNGSPITPNSRNPQIRLTYQHKNKKFLFAALTQNQFNSDGPEGYSPAYLRNARIPILVARAVYDDDKHLYIGGSLLFQRLKPRIESELGYRVNESINSVQATVFATIKQEPFELRQQLTFAQNANNLNLLGGFAVSCIDPATDERTYSNLAVISYWVDININRRIEPGMFIGIIKNIGATKNIVQCYRDPESDREINTIYSLGPDINSIFKCVPRIRFHVLPFDFAFEFECTRAVYGCINNKGKVKGHQPVNHIRGLFASYFYF